MRPGSTALRLLLVSGCASAALAVLWWVMIRTGVGQRLDDLAFEGRKATDLGVRRAVTAAMRLATPVGLLAVAALVLVEPVRRRRWRTAAVAATAMGAVVVVSRVLKDHLVRPELWELTWARHLNTFPSGHSAAWAAVAFTAVVVTSPRRRPVIAGAAVVVLVLYDTAMLWSGWHRPSDVVGATLLAVVVVGVAAAVIDRFGEAASDEAPTTGGRTVWYQDDRAAAIVVAAAVVLPCAAAVAVRNPTPNPLHPLGHHLVALAAVNLVAALSVVTFARTLTRGAPVRPGGGTLGPDGI